MVYSVPSHPFITKQQLSYNTNIKFGYAFNSGLPNVLLEYLDRLMSFVQQ